MVSELVLHEATFRLFGSPCRVVSDVEPSVIAAVHRLEDLQSRWSRFDPRSEISRLNDSREFTPVSEATRLLIERAGQASTRTRGRMNPFILNSLVALGYDRSHELLTPAGSNEERAAGESGESESEARPHEVEFDGASVRLPAGLSFDPGGIGKGLAADLAMDDLLSAGSTWALVSLGGDMRFGGRQLADTGWSTHVEDPHDRSRVAASISMSSGALATSSRLSRTWIHDGHIQHHLIDPRTGVPARSSRVAATVHADDAWWADVVAKVLVIDDLVGPAQLDEWSATAIAFDGDGRVEDLGLPITRIDQLVS